MEKVLVIACGAIARELVRIRDLNGWEHLEFQCLDPELHNRPERIPDAVRQKINEAGEEFSRIFVGYADCGTGGLLDRALQELEFGGQGIERIPGAHCYEFFAGTRVFEQLAEEEVGTFYLTDFLVQHFQRLVVQGLGLDRQPGLMPMYFGNYRRVVHIAQREDKKLLQQSREHAQFLGLEHEYRLLGDEPLARLLQPVLSH